MTDELLFVAHGSSDREPPVIAETAEACAEKAVEEFDLRHSLSEIENWTARHSAANAFHGKYGWRANVRAHWWDYISIHSVEKEEIA